MKSPVDVFVDGNRQNSGGTPGAVDRYQVNFRLSQEIRAEGTRKPYTRFHRVAPHDAPQGSLCMRAHYDRPQQPGPWHPLLSREFYHSLEKNVSLRRHPFVISEPKLQRTRRDLPRHSLGQHGCACCTPFRIPLESFSLAVKRGCPREFLWLAWRAIEFVALVATLRHAPARFPPRRRGPG